MELWDIYDADRAKTGRTAERGAPSEAGAHRLIVHICVFGSDGRMLIQRRTPAKEKWPDMWDVSAAGGVLAGETSREAARRELLEELGLDIDFSERRPALTVNFHGGFDDFYLVESDIPLDRLTFQPDEVADAARAGEAEILGLIGRGEFVPYRPPLIALLFNMRGGLGTLQRRRSGEM